MNKILINADDYGLHSDINLGIEECLKENRVNSVSVSVLGETIDFQKIREFQKKDIKIGCHLTLVGEKWGSSNLFFKNWKDLFLKLNLFSSQNRNYLEQEIFFQIEELIRNNIKIDHLDSHQHVHVFPGIWPIVVRAARKYNIARIRVPYFLGKFKMREPNRDRIRPDLIESK